MNEAIRTQISAFVDGELPQNEAEMLLRRMSQDKELRQLAAEYMALGRAMRGERTMAGSENLRERIAAAIDETSLRQEPGADDKSGPQFLRPVAGVAIAATAALAAILGLQQVTGVADIEELPLADAVADAADSAYTVPKQELDQLREYYLSHSASSSFIGADSFNARLVTLELRDGVLVEIEPDEALAEDRQADDDDESELQTP